MLTAPAGAEGPVPASFGNSAVMSAAPLRTDSEVFIISDPEAPTSPAWRVGTDMADKAGLAPEPTPGFILTNRVIVQTADPAALARALRQRAGARAVPVIKPAGVRGFTLVETASVADAITLTNQLRGAGLVRSAELDIERPRALRGVLPNDPLFSNQWHLRNTALTHADVNAEGAWALGYTGQGVTVGVTEAGFQIAHPDLAPHYDAAASQGGGSSSHATRVAGVFGAVGDNGIGVSGLAYNCNISSQLYGSSSQNAAAFTFRNDLNDIKNDSWGPWDTGELWDGYASSAELQALRDCAELGRGGLGTMTCWAAGNGGTGDRVDYDPYTSSRYTFAIGAIGDLDREATYNELGSSMLVVTHSSGNSRGITTTTTGSTYTSSFGGTSSASPLGAGAVALALEANPSLTWRDVQALLVETARKCDPSDSMWTTNAAGHEINERFGFGAIEAAGLVAAAEVWNNMPAEVSASSGTVAVNTPVPDNNPAGLTRTVEIADDITIESVVVNMNLSTTYVGDLRIVLTSPDGTDSVFSTPRSDSSDNITDYNFMSLRNWGENSVGTWTLKVADEGSGDVPTWHDFSLSVYGTAAADGCNPADIAQPFGVLDLADVSAFISAFLAQAPTADIVPDGVWDLADVQAFILAFMAGCP